MMIAAGIGLAGRGCETTLKTPTTWLRRLYIEGMPLSGAALTHGVSYDTARDWKSWPRPRATVGYRRAAYRISDQGVDDLNKRLVEDFARQVITTTRELEEGQYPCC